MEKSCTSDIFIYFSQGKKTKPLTRHPRKLTRKSERYGWGKALTLKAIGLCDNLDTSVSDQNPKSTTFYLF